MEYIVSKIKNIGRLGVKQFFWDDNALTRTPEAVPIGAKTIQELSGETGLNLKCAWFIGGNLPM